MTRGAYGGGAADFVQTVVGNSYHPAAAAAVTMWSAQTGGTRYTDLQNAALSAITSVTSNADGSLPVFYGPDGIASMWADAGGPERVLLLAYNLLGVVSPVAYVPVLDAAITGITYNSDGSVHVVTYASGVTITYTYNGDGSVHTSSDGTTTRTFTYNSDGTLASVA